MKQTILPPERVLAGYDEVSRLYPHIPSLSLWRGWEYAAYRGRELAEPVLDVGCGDGAYFQLVWPEVQEVYGVDLEAGVVERARESEVYRQVWQADAANMPVESGWFGSVFANCSLEHMDNIRDVLREVHRTLRPGGQFIFSIMTDKIDDWFSLTTLTRALGEEAIGKNLFAEWKNYHHLVNPFSIEHWQELLQNTGFEIVEHIPVVTEMTGRLFLFIDGLWHHQHGSDELGEQLTSYFEQIPQFPQAFRNVLQTTLTLEKDPTVGCGAVLVARKQTHAQDSASVASVPPTALVSDSVRACWCTHSQLVPFSSDYLRCIHCETLVSAVGLSNEQLETRDDSQDFDRREHWFTHMEDLGFATIERRARLDLPERCLHWLRTVLKYKLPPGKALELGSAHGGFVAMLTWAGFEATGLELNPRIVDFARQTFGGPMLLGPLENHEIAPESLDLIVLVDVLEHLPDPVGTMRHCLSLLKADGVLAVQTSRYPEGRSYDELASSGNRFVEMLKSDPCQYLFSRSSIRELFHQLGAEHVEFETAIFAHTAMFLVVSRVPLVERPRESIEHVLASQASGCLVQALLDLDTERQQLRSDQKRNNTLRHQLASLQQQFAESEADRAARLAVIEEQGLQLGEVTAERNILSAQFADLEQHLAQAEADRAARLAVIQEQGQHLGEVTAERNILSAQLAEAEADRAARLAVIQEFGGEIDRLRGTIGIQQQYIDVAEQQITNMAHRLNAVENRVRRTHEAVETIRQSRSYRLLRQAGRWEQIDQLLSQVTESAQDSAETLALMTSSTAQGLSDYKIAIDQFNGAQSNKGLLDAIRAYNHQMVDALDKSFSLKGRRILDVGASPHGYALERALDNGAQAYVGVGLDVTVPDVVVSDTGAMGLLLNMDATALRLPDNSFDAVLSISTFEHVSDVAAVLHEIARVLRPGGRALVSFEPIWSCSYGHHLHHFGDSARVVPPWAHLLWNPDAMRDALRDTWPAEAPISLDEAVEWVYHSPALNRVNIRQFYDLFHNGPLKVEWIVDLKDAVADSAMADRVSQSTGFLVDELTTKGLSVLLSKPDTSDVKLEVITSATKD